MTVEQYAYYVTVFALAKAAKDYELADDIRNILHRVQDVSDQKFLEMHRTKRYTWHPVFSNGEALESNV